METLNDKIVRLLKEKHDAWLGTEGEAERQNFKSGLNWAIGTIETCTRDAEFQEVARQLMQHLGNGEKYHPHYTAIVTTTNAELMEGKQSTGYVEDYISD